MAKLLGDESGGGGSGVSEHIPVRAHRVVPQEQVVSEGLVVEVAFETVHDLGEVVAFFHDVTGEVFFAVPFTLVVFFEAVEVVVEFEVIVNGFRSVEFAHIVVFGDFFEDFLSDPFAIPVFGEALGVLEHKFGGFLIGVDGQAEVDELVVVVEGEVHPQPCRAFRLTNRAAPCLRTPLPRMLGMLW